MSTDRHSTNDFTHAEQPTPTHLLPIVDLLDRLGASERASAPSGMEQRLYDATRPILASSTGVAGRLRPARWATGSRFRMAAGIAVAALGVGAAAWLMPRHGATTTAPETEPAALLASLLEADLLAWQDERSAFASASAEAPLLSLHRTLDTLESGDTVDPLAAIEDAAPETSL